MEASIKIHNLLSFVNHRVSDFLQSMQIPDAEVILGGKSNVLIEP